MSGNNFLACYSSYYGYPGSCCAQYYNKNCCNSCKPQCYNICQNLCNPCQQVCNPCQQVCNPCTTSCPVPCTTPCTTPCPQVSFISNTATATTVTSGGILLPVGTVIASGTTTVPAGTVTVITGFTGTPTTNIGGIIPNNGFFTIPCAGRYTITGNACFSSVVTVATTDYRQLSIYRTDATTGVTTLLATDSRNPISGMPTCINVATTADLASGDRIFFAATQTSTGGVAVNVEAGGRYSITRLC